MALWLWLILLLFGLLMLALSNYLRVGARVSERGAVVWGRWLGLMFCLDSQARAWSLYLLGWRLLSQSLDSGPQAKILPKKLKKPKKPAQPFSSQGLLSPQPQLHWMLGYLRRHLHLEQFELDLNLATPDPALTGMVYGSYQALLPALGWWWPRAKLQVRPNFIEEYPTGTLELALKIRNLHLVVLGWHGLMLLRKLSGLRKQKRSSYGTQRSVDQHGRRNAASG